MSAHGEAAIHGRKRVTQRSGRGSIRFGRWVGAAAATAALAACATYWPTLSAHSTRSRGDTYQCAMDQLKELGYTPRTFNADNGSIDAQRINREASPKLPGEQQQVDKLLVQTERAGDGASTLHVRTETVIRRFTRTGWVEDGERASAAVQQAGHVLIDRCSAAS